MQLSLQSVPIALGVPILHYTLNPELPSSYSVYPLGERGKALAATDMPRPKQNPPHQKKIIIIRKKYPHSEG